MRSPSACNLVGIGSDASRRGIHNGVDGDEAIHTIIDIMTPRAPYATLQFAMHIHPTIGELVPTLLDGLAPMK